MSNSIRSILIFFILFVGANSTHAQDYIKQPNVAHGFYSGNPAQLSAHIKRMLGDAKVKPYNSRVDIIIVPHAGYVYSGLVAAYGFKAASHNQYDTVIIIGPTHYHRMNKVSVWPKGGFRTPLGVAQVNEELAARILAIDERIQFIPEVFDREHSVEVEIPFVQSVFPGASIVPIVMGFVDLTFVAKFAKALNEILADQNALIVISSDLSHFHDDKKARELDGNAIDAIVKQDVEDIVHHNNKTMEIDGVFPVLTAILYAKEKGLRYTDKLKYAHSGHVSGDMQRVVGYPAIAFHNKEPLEKNKTARSLTKRQKKRLVQIARKTIDLYLKKGKVYSVSKRDKDTMPADNGAFVSIYKNKELRGCIGHIISEQPLSELVRDMAIAAATKDPRFPPVTVDELDIVDVEVSVLSKPKRSSVDDIVLGKHGVIISKGNNRGVFLPQVADETGWTKQKFLSVLASQKAGLAPDAWQDPSVTIETFTAEVFDEQEVGLR